MEAERALEIGLVDEVVDVPESVVPRAIEWCREHLKLPRQSMLFMRQMTRSDLQNLFDDRSQLGVEKFVEIWYSDETRRTLQGLVERLKKRP